MRPPRHYYEVIPEGTLVVVSTVLVVLLLGVACKLYFDVEYKMSANPLLDPVCGAELVDVFVKVLSENTVMDSDAPKPTDPIPIHSR